jgi:pycsar effector protein
VTDPTAPPPPSTPAGPAAHEELHDFAWRTHGYMTDQIKSADLKAGAIFTIGLATIRALGTSHAHETFATTPCKWGGSTWLLAGAFILLFLGMIAAGLVVRPRLGSKQPTKAFIFWDRVLAHRSGPDYSQSLSAQPEGALIRDVAEHIYDLSRIVRAKYRWVAVAVNVTLAGAVLAAVVLVIG